MNEGFNPTLVRLAPSSRMTTTTFFCGFNPTLVRLAQASVVAGKLETKRFQSHVGSISTARAMQAKARDKPVSIPRWFD